MGCDIHMHVELKMKPRKDGEPYWHELRRSYFVNTFKGELRIDHRWYPGRNYNEFAILADVRNGRGFAGIKTGEGFEPLSAPKGLPDDASEETERASRLYGEDGHSHSWLTLRELEATPEYWDKLTVFEGDPKQYPYRECAPYLIGTLIPTLRAIMEDYYIGYTHEGERLTKDDVRIVCFFDN